MLLTPYGLREWLGITVIAALIAVGVVLAGWWPVAIVIGVVWLAVLSFFRDPPRRLPPGLGAGDMISPADGRVSAVTIVDEHESTDGPAVIVRIFLSVLNVHVNRAPCDAMVAAIRYTPGTFHDARSAESAIENESNLLTLRRPDGETIGLRQVAGKVARRIVCPLTVGAELRRGAKFGMIKFGSTTELILPRPDDATIHVRVGDRVKGGRTLLATLADAPGA